MDQNRRNSIWSHTSKTTEASSFSYIYFFDGGDTDLSAGRTRLERLILIGVCSNFLGVEALKAAVIEAKEGRDVRKYLEAQYHLEIVGEQEPEAARDQDWVDTVDKRNQAETQRLEAELKGYKNNLIKESVRVSLRLLKHFFYLNLIRSGDGKRRSRSTLSNNWGSPEGIRSIQSHASGRHHSKAHH